MSNTEQNSAGESATLLGMMTNDRDAAENLVRRMDNGPPDSSKVDDEADRPAGDKSPGYANVLMAEAPASSDQDAELDKEATDSP